MTSLVTGNHENLSTHFVRLLILLFGIVRIHDHLTFDEESNVLFLINLQRRL